MKRKVEREYTGRDDKERRGGGEICKNEGK